MSAQEGKGEYMSIELEMTCYSCLKDDAGTKECYDLEQGAPPSLSALVR